MTSSLRRNISILDSGRGVVYPHFLLALLDRVTIELTTSALSLFIIVVDSIILW